MIHPDFDAYSVDASELISYNESNVGSLFLYGFEYIDNLHFLRKPEEIVTNPEQCRNLCRAVEARFKEAGWEGKGKLSILWVPPLALPLGQQDWKGIMLWHVKQHEDGLSWILSPIRLPFEEFEGCYEEES